MCYMLKKKYSINKKYLIFCCVQLLLIRMYNYIIIYELFINYIYYTPGLQKLSLKKTQQNGSCHKIIIEFTGILLAFYYLIIYISQVNNKTLAYSLVFIPSTAADTGGNQAKEWQQGADRYNPITPSIFLVEKRVYHIIGFPLIVFSYPEIPEIENAVSPLRVR